MDARVRHIDFLPLQRVQFNTATPQHAVEMYLRARSAPFTFLRPNFFMQNLSTTYRDDMRVRGEIFVPAARARTAFVDIDDVGRVAECVRTEAGHISRAYTSSSNRCPAATTPTLISAAVGCLRASGSAFVRARSSPIRWR